MTRISNDARTLLNIFVRYKAKVLPFQTLTGHFGVDPKSFQAAMAELVEHGFVEYPTTGIHYRLTFEGWSFLGSPTEIMFPENS